LEEAGKGVLGVGLGVGGDVDAEKKEVEPGLELGLDEDADAEEETYPKGETGGDPNTEPDKRMDISGITPCN
jgi:hypothetical protein